MHASPYRLGPAVALVALVGCSAPVVEEGDEGEGVQTVQGFVAVERISHAGPNTEGVIQTSVSAKFVRISSASAEELAEGAAEDMLGGSLELPAVGECVSISIAGDGSADDAQIALDDIEPMDLLDVGDVTLRSVDAGGDETLIPLAPRAFPDVGDLVSGVFYTSPDADQDLPAPAQYSVETSGASDLDRFVIDAEAPQPPERVFVEGLSLATSGADEPLMLLAGSDLRVEWTSPSRDDAAAEGDLIYVDVVSARSGQAVRCTFADEGRGMVPTAMLTSESLFGATTIGVHRVRRQEFGPASAHPDRPAPPDIDFGQVRFDLSVVGWATIVEGS